MTKAKNILAICHSTGDSEVIFESAKEMMKKSIATTILTVGTTANAKIAEFLAKDSSSEESSDQNISSHVTHKHIGDLIPDFLEGSLALEQEAIRALTEAIKIEAFGGLLVGTPSYVDPKAQCQIPEQLLESWAPQIPSAVVSDYAYYEQEHQLSTKKWFEKADKFLVPFKKAIAAFQANPESTVVVGHAGIDATKKGFKEWLTENDAENESKTQDNARVQIRNKLGLEAGQKFIFVAGGKANDEKMIEALAITCAKFPEIKVFIGLHPAADLSYKEKLLSIISEHNVSHIMQLIPPGISTQQALYNAQATATVTSTVGSMAAECKQLALFYQEGKKENDAGLPYVLGEEETTAMFGSSPASFTQLFERVKAAAPIKSEDIKIEETAASRIAVEMKNLISHKKRLS